MFKFVLYKYLYRYALPYLPDSKGFSYLKWKAAIVLVGTEFHLTNLDKNREKIAAYFDEETLLQEELADLLDISFSGDVPRILDVGAGPVSKVGKVYLNRKIELVPVDAIAKRYNNILSRLKLIPPFPTQFGTGEHLSRQFDRSSFDLIHARNCIDHCRKPIEVIRQALILLKPNCYFYLNHYVNEGSSTNYYGLHQWNFKSESSQFVITDRFDNKLIVNELISDLAKIVKIQVDKDRIIVVLKKI